MTDGIDTRTWRNFPPAPRPKGMRKRADKACYRNVCMVVIDKRYRNDFTYAEGIAVSDLGFPVHHAWVVDRDGNAVDPTWPEPGRRYWGTTFDAVASAVSSAL